MLNYNSKNLQLTPMIGVLKKSCCINNAISSLFTNQNYVIRFFFIQLRLLSHGKQIHISGFAPSGFLLL